MTLRKINKIFFSSCSSVSPSVFNDSFFLWLIDFPHLENNAEPEAFITFDDTTSENLHTFFIFFEIK
jgi:hypothetical protein